MTSTTKSVAYEQPGSHGEAAQTPGSLPDETTSPAAAQAFSNQAARVLGRSSSFGASTEAQLGELLNRLQAATHSINNVYNEVVSLDQRMEQRQADMDSRLGEGPRQTEQQLGAVLARLSDLEATLQRMQREGEGRDYREHFTTLGRTQAELLSELPRALALGEFVLRSILASSESRVC